MQAYKKAQYAASPAQRRKAIERAEAYKKANLEKILTYQERYREDHRDELRLAEAQRRQRLGEELRARERLRAKTPLRKVQVQQRHQERMATEPEYAARMLRHSRKAGLKHYHKHRASLLEDARQRYWANPEQSREKTRCSLQRWRQAHPETVAAINARRKAICRGAQGECFDDEEHYKMLAWWQQGRCYHCDGPLEPCHKDHLVSVIRGGQYIAGNIALSCGRCNMSKNAKTLWAEWVPPLTFQALILMNLPALVISTFAASERGSREPRQVLAKLRVDFPGIPLIFDWEWLRRRSAVRNVLSAHQGDAPVVQARKTQLVCLDTDQARDFLNTYHLQGFGRGTAYTGLVSNNELVAVAAWLEVKGAIELNRMAFKNRVVGGAGKLLTGFCRDLRPMGIPIVTFADLRHGEGKVYERLGFAAAGETAHPIYYYTGPAGLFHRRLFTKDLLARRFSLFDAAETEQENARRNGYYRVFGLNQRRFFLQ